MAGDRIERTGDAPAPHWTWTRGALLAAVVTAGFAWTLGSWVLVIALLVDTTSGRFGTYVGALTLAVPVLATAAAAFAVGVQCQRRHRLLWYGAGLAVVTWIVLVSALVGAEASAA